MKNKTCQMLHREASRAAALLLCACGVLTGSNSPTLSKESANVLHAESRGEAGDVLETVRDYQIPGVQLIREDGKQVSLPEEIDDGRAVVLNFIFTTCSSTCPLMSEVFAAFDHKLGPERDQVHLMSISIDPEEDTPSRLREYARKFRAGPEWRHYTGTVEASLTAQRAFDVYRGDKMSHVPVTLLRGAPGKRWLRVDGLLTPDALLAEYKKVRDSR